MTSRRPRAARHLAAATLTVLAAVSVLTPIQTALGAPAAARSEDGVAVVWPPLAATWPAPPPVTATSYVLMDLETGQTLAARGADTRLPVASTIKVLTVLTALPHVRFDDVVTVGPEVQVGGAGVGLDPGEQWLMEDLLEAVIARSGNDAARAVAAHVGGSIDGFVDMMRATATELGVDGAVILDPSGLDDTNLLSARELATITRAAMRDPRFRDIAVRSRVALPEVGTLESRNVLLEEFAGATGVKTGYTDLAGWCFIGSAVREGRELIAVVLDARDDPSRFDDAAALLSHGFDAHQAVPLPVDLRVRTAGRWVDHPLPVGHVWLATEQPRGAGGVVSLWPPIEASSPVEVVVTWDDELVADLRSLPAGLPAGRLEDTAAAPLGHRWASAMYEAMRAAHRSGTWAAVREADG